MALQNITNPELWALFMSRETDFLIYYDLADAEERNRLLEIAFPPEEAGVVRRFLSDRLARARLEFSYNRALPFEDFLLCQKHGYIQTADEFISHTRAAYGREFPNICFTEKERSDPVNILGVEDSYRYFTPFVEAYICRHTGSGVVADRTALEVAIDIGDVEFLALVVDPNTGDHIFQELLSRTSGNTKSSSWHLSMLRKRRKKLSWWSIDERGVIVHDLTKGNERNCSGLRNLPWDQDLRAITGR